MSQRFYCDQPIVGDHATLAGSEAHHLLHVLRAAVGDRVVLFDGSGVEFDASVASLGRSEVRLAIAARHTIDREAKTPLTLAVPLPKGDRSRWLVEKAVELGVARIVPLITARSTSGKEKGVEKLDRFVIEASKQCGRNRLLEIAVPLRFEELLRAEWDGALRLIAHPPNGRDEDGGTRGLGPPYSARESPATIAAIGPEGGFTDEEVDAAIAAGWQCVSLGPRILRVETAVLAIAARFVG